MLPIPLTRVAKPPDIDALRALFEEQLAELQREKRDLEIRLHALEGAEAHHAARAQNFFAILRDETRKPHFGDQAREWTRALLLRAQEAGLFTP